MADRKKKEKKAEEGSPDWLLTFGDLNSLLLTFFVFLLANASFNVSETRLILSSFQGSFGIMPGGRTLSSGILAELGNTVESLPSTEKGRSMAKALKESVALLYPEIKARKVVVDLTERGLRVSLSTDAYFKKGSAELNIDTARQVLEKVAVLLNWQDLKQRKIRIEGHTDNSPTDPDGPWPTNWHLSDARALSVLGFLIDFGVEDPSRLSTAGYGEYQPILPNDSEEHMSKNRRVDIIILKEF